MMIGYKTAVWRNVLGQEIVFDNVRFFVESIDMTGTTGIHTVESLMMSDGQETIRHQLGAKTIPCSFAVKDAEDDIYMQHHIAQVLSPLIPGVLTVYTRDSKYTIECYPQDAPGFTRDSGVDFVYRFNVDFVADYPYWYKDEQVRKSYRNLPAINSRKTIVSGCPFDIPPEIYIPVCSETMQIQLYPTGSSSQGFRIFAHDYPVIVRCKDFKVVRADTGADCSQIIDATAELDDIRIRYGKNTVVVSPDTGVEFRYYYLSMGEV